MTKQEIEQAIENGESVWYPKGRTIKQIDLKNTHPIFNGYQIDIMIEDENGWHTEFYGIEDLYKTKPEAEHFLYHANISRIEKLPFLTWEEFLEKEYFEFFNGGKGFRLYISHTHNENIRIITFNRYNPDGDVIFEMPQTEANFYKAYDECVRLFRGFD